MNPIILIAIIAVAIYVIVCIYRFIKNARSGEPYLAKIKVPKLRHYYVTYYNSEKVIVQFVSQACWNLTLRIVDDSYIEQVDGELVKGKYSFIFKK